MNTLQTIKEQLVRLRGSEAQNVQHDTLISQVLDSRSFLTLLVSLERCLQVTVSDEDFYSRAPLTLGDLADFFTELKAPETRAVNP
jgi:acyl carrier protein